ncbi:uncharacterized protein [Nicotiana sylvestris]|uniref:uncharacterized protein n=1 Tax=Nicotiana sylvestris TaxID=4096 RepID=UPI00388CA406
MTLDTFRWGCGFHATPGREFQMEPSRGHLDENPVGGEYKPLQTYFPDKEVSFVGEDIAEAYDGWRMFFDGAANFKRAGIRAVLVSEIGQHYPISTKLRFPCTKNMVEYEACIMGLNLAIDINIQELLVIGDSDLLVHQVQGEWTMKNTKILPYVYHVQELMKRFTKIEFKHVPRIQNKFADALTTLSSMIQHPDKNFIDSISVKIHNHPAYCAHVEEEWMETFVPRHQRILGKRRIPGTSKLYSETHTQRLSNHFFQRGGNLYRRTPILGLLGVLTQMRLPDCLRRYMSELVDNI